jgi:diguanylate cyclase (GGDEF)-like protein
MTSIQNPIDLGGGFFRLGGSQLFGELQSNIYLLIDAGEAILFGPGAAVNLQELKENIIKCASLRPITTIVVHQQEPSSSSALIYLEKEGSPAAIATHWRTWDQLRFYGLSTQPYIIDEHAWSLRLSSGRVLQFLPTPYLYQPGAFATYDRTTKTLLTGALLSSYSETMGVYAEDEKFLDRLKAFHRVNMPSGEFLAPVMRILEKWDIERVMPSYGPIMQSGVKHVFSELAGLECGELARPEGVEALYAGMEQFGATNAEVARLKQEIETLRKLNEELNHSIAVSKDRAIRDAVTGLYSEIFYKSFIDEEMAIRITEAGPEDHVLAVFGIDENIAQIEYKYGSREVEALLRGVAELIEENLPKTAMAFRLHGATMAVWIPSILFDRAIELFDKIRYQIETSKAFVEPVTVSVGVATLAEAMDTQPALEKVAVDMTDLGIRRLRLARRRGGNTLYFASNEENGNDVKARILIVDDDEVNVDVLKTYLTNEGYSIMTAADGQEALSILGKEIIDLVITELMVPKIDAYLLKESMLSKSATKDIPVIVISHLKTELTIRRAYRLGIIHYLQKPIILEELLGIVQNLTQMGSGA